MKALLIVDVQNDFCPGGSLAVAEGDQVVPPINRLITAFADRELPVIFTRDWHTPDHSSFSDFGGIWPGHCIAGTAGADFHGDLKIPGDSLIISKADKRETDAYSGFEGTDLRQKLDKLGVDSIVTAGLATDYCVKNTVADALAAGFRTVVAEDAVRAVNVEAGDGDDAIEYMKEKGALFLNSSEIITGL